MNNIQEKVIEFAKVNTKLKAEWFIKEMLILKPLDRSPEYIQGWRKGVKDCVKFEEFVQGEMDADIEKIIESGDNSSGTNKHD